MAITVAERGLVTVFGGSGFLGRHVVRALLKRGWRVRAAVRRPDLAGHLQPLGQIGWVQPGAGQPALSLVGRPRRRRRRCGDQPRRPSSAIPAASASTRSTSSAPARLPRRPARPASRRWCTSRRSARIQRRLPPTAGARRPARRPSSRRCPMRGDAPVLHLRAGGPVLQPVRRAGPLLAGLSADRRRADPPAAGVRRRRRAGHRRFARGQGGAGPDLRARRAGSEDAPRMRRIRARRGRPQAPAPAAARGRSRALPAPSCNTCRAS